MNRSVFINFKKKCSILFIVALLVTANGKIIFAERGRRKTVITLSNEFIANKIMKDCKVAMLQIKNWISEGRLHTADEKDICLHCKICGRAVLTGNFCNICKWQLLNDLGM